jgi:hypothetical protein
MKRFTVPVDFAGVKAPFHIYVGEPLGRGVHPLKYQAMWLKEERGGTVPQDVMDSFAKLHAIAAENRVSFEDLCVYALGQAQQESSSQGSGATVE